MPPKSRNKNKSSKPQSSGPQAGPSQGEWADGAAESSQRQQQRAKSGHSAASYHGHGGQRGGGGQASSVQQRQPQVFTNNGNIPPLSETSLAIENQYVKEVQAAAKNNVEIRLPDPESTKLIPRPAYGSEQGKSVKLWANSFRLHIADHVKFHAYSIQLQPDVKRTAHRQRIVKQVLLTNESFIKEHSDKFITDWSRFIILPYDLFPESLLYKEAPRNDSSQHLQLQEPHQITLNKWAENGVIAVQDLLEDMSNSELDAKMTNRAPLLRMLNFLVSYHARMDENITLVGSNRIFLCNSQAAVKREPLAFREIGGGLQATKGFYHSVKPVAGGLTLNVNVSTGTFYKAQRLDLCIREFMEKIEPGTYDEQIGKLNKFLKGVRVSLMHRSHQDKTTGHPKPIIKSVLGLAHEKESALCLDTDLDGRPQKAKLISDDGERLNVFNKKQMEKLSIGWSPTAISFWQEGEHSHSGTEKSGSEKKKGATPFKSAGSYVTVWEYFKDKYNFILDEDQPVVNLGTRDRPQYVPSTLCEVEPGQYFSHNISDAQMRQISTLSCKRPFENLEYINNVAPRMFAFERSMTLKSFDASIGTTLMTVPGRMLIPPTLVFGGNITVTNHGGRWHYQGKKFSTTRKEPISWAFLDLGEGKLDFDLTSTLFRTEFGKYNLRLKDNPIMYHLNVSSDSEALLDRKFQEFEDLGVEIVFAGLSNYNSGLYNTIKRLGDDCYGIHTNIMVTKGRGKLIEVVAKAQRNALTGSDKGLLANMALKVNAKFSGVNHTLKGDFLGFPARKKKIMIVGIDVGHPGENSKAYAPSFAAVVASVDADFAQWPADVRSQRWSRDEIVYDIFDMFLSRLELFRDTNDSYPDFIVIYRDGVSDPQFFQVIAYELSKILAACEMVYIAEPQPKIKLIICVKRHANRVGGTNVDDIDQTSNLPGGLVVERSLNDFRVFDFYLQPHNAILGTARPCRYIVLRNDKFDAGPSENEADRIQRMTLNLCYVHPRASTAVGVVTPVYLADLACERARRHLPNDLWHRKPGDHAYINPDAPSTGVNSMQLDTGNTSHEAHLVRHENKREDKEQAISEDEQEICPEDAEDSKEGYGSAIEGQKEQADKPAVQGGHGPNEASSTAPERSHAASQSTTSATVGWKEDADRRSKKHKARKSQAKEVKMRAKEVTAASGAAEHKAFSTAPFKALEGSSWTETAPRHSARSIRPKDTATAVFGQAFPKGIFNQTMGRPADIINQDEGHERWRGEPVREEYKANKVHERLRNQMYYI